MIASSPAFEPAASPSLASAGAAAGASASGTGSTAGTGGGAGLRLLINKRSKTNLCFDVGFGKQGSRGVYLAIQEAL